jgi:hypothetical protein
VIAAVVENALLLQDPMPALSIACNTLDEEYRLTITGYAGIVDLVNMVHAFRAEARIQLLQPVRQVCYNERAKAYIIVIERGDSPLPMVTARNRYRPQLDVARQQQQQHINDVDVIERSIKAREFARARLQQFDCVEQVDIPYVRAVLECIANMELPTPDDMVMSCLSSSPLTYRILFSGFTKLIDLVVMVNTFLGTGRSPDLHAVEMLFRHEDDGFWVIEMQKTGEKQHEPQQHQHQQRHPRRRARE